jgi:acetyl esterase/lipase
MIERNIRYAERSTEKNILDVVYEPGKTGSAVIFFIHGGSWMSGSKDMYTKLGENFLGKGFVSVIINYRLFPTTDLYGMAADCSDAFKWCKENIERFGGDREQIYLMGHSAGGHLAAVTGLSEADPNKFVAGFIIVDAFGLSAFHFLTEYGMMLPEFFIEVFGKDRQRWHLISPDKLLKGELPPFLILTGGATYPFLRFDNENFVDLLKKARNSCEHRVIPSLSHMQMIYQFENKNAKIYSEIQEWINNSNRKNAA